MEDTMLELLEVCRQKEEVKNVIKQPTKRGTRIAESLQNFRVKKNSTSLNNKSQISPVNSITPILPTEEPEYSLSMGYEHLSTIPVTELDEVIKSSVKNLVPIPSEYEVTFDDKSDCDVPVKDESSLVFTTFSNPIFDDNDDFISSDDESLSDEENVSMEDFKVYSNPLFDDEEINFDEIDPHYFNTESDFVESLSNRDTLFNSSLKFDYLEEFSGELMPTSDSDSLREEIDIFISTDDLIPPGIESDDYDSEGDIPENESSNFNHHDDPSFPRPPPKPPDVEFFFDLEPNSGEVISAVMNNTDELNEDECFDPGDIDVFANVEDDDYFPFIFVIQFFLPYLIYPEDSPLLLSAGTYSDSDYARANLDRKSTIRGCQFLGRRLFSWQCKKQTIVATSTTEAEYVAATNCCGQIFTDNLNYSIMTDLALAHQHNMIAYLENTKMVEGEGSGNPPESQPTPSTAQPINESQIPDSSSSPQNTRGGDSLVRAATTASLDAQQGSSNITKTQSKATLNEPTPQRKSSGSDLGRQETIGDEDADTEMIVKDKGNGEKGGNTAETVSIARTDISATRPKVSTAEPKTPPTTTTLFDDKDVTIADTLVKMKNQKAKEKRIAFKDADDPERPIRSITTFQPLPTIDPKDKGKGILQEPEPMKKTKKKDQDQIKRYAKVPLKTQAHLNEEAMIERERQEEASKAALAEM
nr:putative ribonuclease H-like domain-containing protein [Tanacetum cinerariifolium]